MRFFETLVETDIQKDEQKQAKKAQQIDDGIDAQKRVLAVPNQKWSQIRHIGIEKQFLTEKEAGIIRVAEQIPNKIPTVKQCGVLLGVLEKAQAEGLM